MIALPQPPTLEQLHRDAFAREHGATLGRWSAHNLSRWARTTGERPQRLVRLRTELATLGCSPTSEWPNQWGIFDHGHIWIRDGRPWAIVGHPYHVSEGEWSLLRRMALTYPSLCVHLDDRPSYYGHGTHHVRIEVAEPRRPWRQPRATPATRAAFRQFKAAMEDAG